MQTQMMKQNQLKDAFQMKKIYSELGKNQEKRYAEKRNN